MIKQKLSTVLDAENLKMVVKNPVPSLHEFSLLRWRGVWGPGAAWRIHYKQYHDGDVK